MYYKMKEKVVLNKQYFINIFFLIVRIFASTLSSIYLITEDLGQVSIIVYVALAILFYLTFMNFATNKQISALSVLFTFLLVLGNDLLGDWLANKTFISGLFALLIIYGWYSIMKLIICYFYKAWASVEDKIRMNTKETKDKRKRYFWFSFVLFWCIYFVFFMNQYPGSLSCDTPQQIRQAIGYSPYENANPLINTLLISVCVRLGIMLFEDINAGVAIYTVVQFTLAAVIFAYAVSVIYKKGYHRGVVITGIVFWGLMPYNIVYATGMWKDTFFALSFLLTLVFLWDCCEQWHLLKIRHYIYLLILVIICSLARNSGWSSLLLMTALMLGYVVKYKHKPLLKILLTTLAGISCSFFITGVIYPAMNVYSEIKSISALSVPLQQVARVVAIDCDLSVEEEVLINKAIQKERVAEIYDESLSDPIKWAVNREIIEANMEEYTHLWINLGLRYPKCYLDAYVALTRNYWYPDSASWTWDTRIFENDMGIVRTPQIFKDIDLANLLSKLFEFPKGSILKSSSIGLWIILFCLGYAMMRKNKFGSLFYSPLLAIYVGLLFTSPVALFRYTYGAVICLPLCICLPYLRENMPTKSIVKESENVS